MTIQRTDIYDQLKGNPYFDQDNRCCTVVALHAIIGVSFEFCQSYMKKFGRKHGRGMYRKDWCKALENMEGYLVKKGPYTKENRITIKKSIEKHPQGKYYCSSRGHAFAITIYDSKRMTS